METLEGKIAAILDKNTVVINRGSLDGVQLRDEFYIYSLIGPITDPDTKENLGTTKKVWGKVVVTRLEERFCVAETDYELNNLLIFRNMLGSRVELPVDEYDISKGLTKIKVGFAVFSRKSLPAIAQTKVERLPEPTEQDASVSHPLEPEQNSHTDAETAQE